MKEEKHCWGVVLNRSSHRRCSIKKGVLGNFVKFTGKYLCQRLFFNKQWQQRWVFVYQLSGCGFESGCFRLICVYWTVQIELGINYCFSHLFFRNILHPLIKLSYSCVYFIVLINSISTWGGRRRGGKFHF